MWTWRNFCDFWRKGGNWGAFFLFWFISSAIISAFEHSAQNIYLNEQEQEKQVVTAFSGFLKAQKISFENNTDVNNQIERILAVVDENVEDVARLLLKTDIETALIQHRLLKTILDIVKDEFVRIESTLDEDDTKGKSLARRFIQLLSEKNTLEVFLQSGLKHIKKLKEEEKEWEKCVKQEGADESCDQQHWTESYGNALHLTSTVFTTTGFGAHTPITTAGKFVTILLIIVQVPFFLHCLATTAYHINKFLDNVLGISGKHEDLESLTTDAGNTHQRRVVLLQGLVILSGALVTHMAVATVYHFCTTGWSFSDVLYFEFVRTASVGFGDLIPEDEYTLLGAIFKNLLVHIPSQVLTFAMFVRALPMLS